MRELEATEAERSTIRSQINCSDVTKPTPQNMRGHFWFSTHRIETARYLQDNFKGEFSNVYPGESITSADLLEGKVTAEDLRKHINVDTGNSQMDGELRDAASIALIVHENNTTDATVKLRGIATSKKADVSQRQRLNAIHALSFLYPKGFKKASPIEYTAQQERDLANPFGGEGDALESKIVIPSSDELRASRRGGPKKKGRISSLNEPDPQIKPIEAEKQDALDLVNTPLVGEWKKVTEKMMDLLNELNAAFGSCPGKPKGFTYNGWMRRKGGGTIVYFQDQRIKVASHYEDSGLPVKIKTGKHKGEQVYIVLTKQDEYDENRRYIGTTFGFLDEYLEKDENKRPAHIKLD
jgi:hypothetical protein